MGNREELVAQAKQKFERQQLLAAAKKKFSAESGAPEDPGFGGKALDYGLRALDYPGGLIRTGAAGLIGVAGKDDFKKAFVGQAPGSADYLERAGLDEGPRFDLNPLAEGDTSLRDIEGFGLDVVSDPLTLVAKGVKGAKGLIGKAGRLATRPIGEALESTGKKTYKSGLKRIDQEVAKYGKEPVSDVLMNERITGSAREIFDKMNILGEKLFNERTDILKGATRKGAEVDMQRAVREAQGVVNKMLNVDNPETVKAAQLMQKRINKYLARLPKEPEQVLRELPRQGISLPESEIQLLGDYTKPERKFLDLPVQGDLVPGGALVDKGGEEVIDANMRTIQKPDAVVPRPPVQASYVEPGGFTPGKIEKVPERFVPRPPATVIDETERVAGPNPLQTSSWKSSAASNVGKQAWKDLSMTKEGKQFDKALAAGLKGATEESVAKALGPEAAEALKKKNADLGKILTSRERALMDAEQEGRKNAFTSVDGGLLGLILSDPKKAALLVVKKVADVAKLTGPRTKGGLLMQDVGKSSQLDAIARRKAIDANRD